jgi:hypothetical protein
MQTIRIRTFSANDAEGGRTGPARDLSPLAAGAATAVAGVGAVLALTDVNWPMRAAFTLFFLLAAPTGAIATALRGLDPFGRLLASVTGAVVVNMLVSEGMLAVHRWSVRGGVVAVTALSLLVLLPALARPMAGITNRMGKIRSSR